MLCTVYVLRQAGIKLPRDAVESHAATGWLVLGQDLRKAYPQVTARLFQSSMVLIDMVEPMVHAHVKKIDGGGILIYGQDEQPAYHAPNTPQVWWCKPGELDGG